MDSSSNTFRSVAACMRRNGNVASRQTLLRAGIPATTIDVARRAGVLERLRRSMYALPEADIDQRRAVIAGGRIGCVSALRRAGVWGGLDAALHIHVPSSASRLHLSEITILGRSPEIRRTDDAFWAEPGEPRVHWQRDHRAAHPAASSWADDWLADPMSALRQAVLCLDDEHAIAAIDSALRKKSFVPTILGRFSGGFHGACIASNSRSTSSPTQAPSRSCGCGCVGLASSSSRRSASPALANSTC
jgi:hypothetical protein